MEIIIAALRAVCDAGDLKYTKETIVRTIIMGTDEGGAFRFN